MGFQMLLQLFQNIESPQLNRLSIVDLPTILVNKHILKPTLNQNEFIFPKRFSISVRSSENFEATLDYSKIVFNEKQKLPFKIPSSYAESE